MTAEVAATANQKVKYAQGLLDLVKAFDRILLWLLVREAIALGYPLRVLRLSVAVYKLSRVIRIGGGGVSLGIGPERYHGRFGFRYLRDAIDYDASSRHGSEAFP